MFAGCRPRGLGISTATLVLACACLAKPLESSAAQFPLWEAGLGATVLRFSDYRGSDEFRSYLFPLPYFIYRGERINCPILSIAASASRLIVIACAGNFSKPSAWSWTSASMAPCR